MGIAQIDGILILICIQHWWQEHRKASTNKNIFFYYSILQNNNKYSLRFLMIEIFIVFKYNASYIRQNNIHADVEAFT